MAAQGPPVSLGQTEEVHSAMPAGSSQQLQLCICRAEGEGVDGSWIGAPPEAECQAELHAAVRGVAVGLRGAQRTYFAAGARQEACQTALCMQRP